MHASASKRKTAKGRVGLAVVIVALAGLVFAAGPAMAAWQGTSPATMPSAYAAAAAAGASLGGGVALPPGQVKARVLAWRMNGQEIATSAPGGYVAAVPPVTRPAAHAIGKGMPVGEPMVASAAWKIVATGLIAVTVVLALGMLLGFLGRSERRQERVTTTTASVTLRPAAGAPDTSHEDKRMPHAA
jgi:hypothetical protein